MKAERIPLKTMSEYALWWKQRMENIPAISFSSGILWIKNITSDRSVQIHISLPDGTETILPPAEQILLETIRWQKQPEPWHAPEDYLRMRKFNYRIPLVRGLDALMNLWKRN